MRLLITLVLRSDDLHMTVLLSPLTNDMSTVQRWIWFVSRSV